MIPRRSPRFMSQAHRLGALAFLVLSFASAKSALAQDDPAQGPPADDKADATSPTPPPKKPTAEEPAPPAPAPVEKSDAKAEETPSVIDRLPPSAYPEPHVRGLHGGSLWLNSQGLQWPYTPRTGIGVSGYAWLDTSYERITVGDQNQRNIKEVLQQGRFLLRVTPTYSHGDYFVQAQGELVANKDQTQGQPVNADVDDAWVRAGKWQAFDLTVGRFEAFEVYHLGMGLDLNTEERRGAHDQNFFPPDLYGASFLFYRPGGPGNIALHLYPTDYLRIEVLGQVGNDGKFNSVGNRTAAIFDIGWLKLKAAAEYQLETAQLAQDESKKENRGVGGSAQIVLDPYVEFGANGGFALVDTFDNVGNQDTQNSTTKRSVGGFANARIGMLFGVPELLIGGGVNDVQVRDQHYDITTGLYGRFGNLQTFGALQYFWESQLMIKAVFAYATADNDPTFSPTPSYTNKLISGRLRFEYLF